MGSPRWAELSNTVPSVSVPGECTFTLSVAVGLAPLPGLSVGATAPERVERLLLFGLQLGLGRQGAGGAGDEQQGENERRYSHRGSFLPVVSITIRPMRRRRPLLPLPGK